MRKRLDGDESAEAVALSVAKAYKSHVANLTVSTSRLNEKLAASMKKQRKHHHKSFTAKIDPTDEVNTTPTK